jgi:hypothetical protein
MRTVQVTDQTPATITVNPGENSVVEGNTYTDPGARRTDAVDGSGVVILVSGSVNTSVVGTYVLTYRYIDQNDNVVLVTRTVTVTSRGL